MKYGTWSGAFLATVAFCGTVARAQTAPPIVEAPLPPSAGPVWPPAPQAPQNILLSTFPPEEARDLQASAEYDQAIRAETLRKWQEARRLAEQVLALSPAGRYEPAARRLINRLALEETAVDGAAQVSKYAGRSSSGGARARFVISATVQGLIAGLLVGLAVPVNNGNDADAIAGGGLIGLAVGLVPSLLVGPLVADPAFEAHLTLGGFFGAGVGGALAGITNASGNAPELAVAFGMVVGALTGIAVAAGTDVTEGDGEAGTACLLHGVTEVLLVLAAVSSATQGNLSGPALSGVGLAAGTVGLLLGELANRQLHWSDLRWALITIGGFLGGGVGALIGVLAANGSGSNSSTTGNLVAAAIGELVGLVATWYGTSGLAPEAPRGVDPEASLPPAESAETRWPPRNQFEARAWSPLPCRCFASSQRAPPSPAGPCRLPQSLSWSLTKSSGTESSSRKLPLPGTMLASSRSEPSLLSPWA